MEATWIIGAKQSIIGNTHLIDLKAPEIYEKYVKIHAIEMGMQKNLCSYQIPIVKELSERIIMSELESYKPNISQI